MQPITAFRTSTLDMPWETCGRVLAQILTSDEWSSERAHLVGRTRLHFIVAVRGVEAVEDALRFRLIADSPDLRHPLTGWVELCPDEPRSELRVSLRANLAEEPPESHLMVREAIASLADVLGRTITAAVAPPAEEPASGAGQG